MRYSLIESKKKVFVPLFMKVSILLGIFGFIFLVIGGYYLAGREDKYTDLIAKSNLQLEENKKIYNQLKIKDQKNKSQLALKQLVLSNNGDIINKFNSLLSIVPDEVTLKRLTILDEDLEIIGSVSSKEYYEKEFAMRLNTLYKSSGVEFFEEDGELLFKFISGENGMDVGSSE